MSSPTPLSAVRGNAASASPPASPAATFNRYLISHRDQLAAALPKHLNAERMSRLALTAFSQSRQLQECDPKSIFAAVVLSSQMGLEIGVGGQAYIVPYKRTATFVPGWQGIVDLVSRTGRATVWTGAVFEGDEFDYALGDRPYVKHRPGGEDDPNKLTHVYSVGRVNGSDWPVIEVWPIKRIAKHFKKFNKVGDKHYAHTNWEMYARKIPLLQVCKYMPKSVELTAALTADHAAESGRGMTFDGEFVTLGDELPDGTQDVQQAVQREVGATVEQAKQAPPATATEKGKQPTADNGPAPNGYGAE